MSVVSYGAGGLFDPTAHVHVSTFPPSPADEATALGLLYGAAHEASNAVPTCDVRAEYQYGAGTYWVRLDVFDPALPRRSPITARHRHTASHVLYGALCRAYRRARGVRP